MKYFLDCEFIDTGREIDLISIGIVDENNRSYYAINADCDLNKASDWVKENVIEQLPPKNPIPTEVSPRLWEESKAWKSYQQIRRDILEYFVNTDGATIKDIIDDLVIDYQFLYKKNKPEIWSYYGAYDYVVFCQLMCSRPKKVKNIFQYLSHLFKKEAQSYNPMVEAYPKFLPYYFREIKQLCDHLGNPRLPEQKEGHHNALEDARWNKQAYELLQTLKLPHGNY